MYSKIILLNNFTWLGATLFSLWKSPEEGSWPLSLVYAEVIMQNVLLEEKTTTESLNLHNSLHMYLCSADK